MKTTNPIPELDASFGIIPLKKEGTSWRVFIIRHIKGDHWGFPKGHPSSLVRAFSSASYAGQTPTSFSGGLSLRSQENYDGQVPSLPFKTYPAESKKTPLNKPETPRETAERELREETGLTVIRYLHFEPFSTRYLCISHGKYVNKTVTYFVAEVEGTEKLCPQEIAEGAWCTLEEALEKMQFPEMKEIVEKLKAILSQDVF